MKKILSFSALFLVLLITILLLIPNRSYADLNLVSDTLSTSRLSLSGRVLTLSGNLFTIDPTASGNAVSTSTANLKDGDSILINAVSETVKAIESLTPNQFTTVNNTPAGVAGNTIYYVSQPIHQINVRTQTSVPGGYFRVLIPNGSASGSNNDGLPDRDGFDFNSMTNTYATASATANFAFVASYTGATVSGGSQCTAGYHCFEFHYTGTGPANSDITLWIGTAAKSLVAPAPATGHALGIADTYTVIVQQFANATNPSVAIPVDATNGKIALIESVRVTATVDPSISFQIAGIANGQAACGATIGNTTVNTQTANNAPLTVPFGSLSLNTFALAAHQLLVSTNAANGYIVTAIENQKMGKDGGASPTIPNTTCAAGPCTYVTSANWPTAAGFPGLGYSLNPVSGASTDFNSSASTAARPFPDASLSQPPQRIMYSAGVSNNHTANICYKISVDATQAAGDYENMVTYTATATF